MLNVSTTIVGQRRRENHESTRSRRWGLVNILLARIRMSAEINQSAKNGIAMDPTQNTIWAKDNPHTALFNSASGIPRSIQVFSLELAAKTSGTRASVSDEISHICPASLSLMRTNST